jgi:hypothetical protein
VLVPQIEPDGPMKGPNSTAILCEASGASSGARTGRDDQYRELEYSAPGIKDHSSRCPTASGSLETSGECDLRQIAIRLSGPKSLVVDVASLAIMRMQADLQYLDF